MVHTTKKCSYNVFILVSSWGRDYSRSQGVGSGNETRSSLHEKSCREFMLGFVKHGLPGAQRACVASLLLTHVISLPDPDPYAVMYTTVC